MKVAAAIEIVKALTAAIHDLKKVPSGHLYATVMGTLSLANYQGALGAIKRAGLIEISESHMITWVGPTLPRA